MSINSTTTASQGKHLYLIIVYDFEARGDIGSFGGMFLFGLPTLASIGASVLAVECSPDSASIYVPDLGSLQTFSDVFPTIYSDQEWAKMPSSASSFWERHPDAMSALRNQGHKQVSLTEFQIYMKQSSTRFAQWIMNLLVEAKRVPGVDKATLIFATDTASSDSKRLMSYLSHSGVYSPPYDFLGNYNGFKEWDYTQLRNAIRLTGKEGEPDLKSETTLLVPIKRNHVASTDAQAQMYEVLWTLLWATTEPSTFQEIQRYWTTYVQMFNMPPPAFRPVWPNPQAQILRNYMESM